MKGKTLEKKTGRFSIKSRKVIAFFVINFEIVGAFLGFLFLAPHLLASVFPPMLTALVGNSMVFVGGLTWEKWQERRYSPNALSEDKQ